MTGPTRLRLSLVLLTIGFGVVLNYWTWASSEYGRPGTVAVAALQLELSAATLVEFEGIAGSRYLFRSGDAQSLRRIMAKRGWDAHDQNGACIVFCQLPPSSDRKRLHGPHCWSGRLLHGYVSACTARYTVWVETEVEEAPQGHAVQGPTPPALTGPPPVHRRELAMFSRWIDLMVFRLGTLKVSPSRRTDAPGGTRSGLSVWQKCCLPSSSST